MSRVVIHNYLPKRRARDVGGLEYETVATLKSRISNWREYAKHGTAAEKQRYEKQVKEAEAELDRRRSGKDANAGAPRIPSQQSAFNGGGSDAKPKLEIEIKGKKYPLAANTDAAIDAVIKRLGLWKKGRDFPDFTVYEDGEETGGGGGPNSGAMDLLPTLGTMSSGDDSSEVIALKAKAREISQHIDEIVNSGGRVGLGDPLSIQLSQTRGKIAAAKKRAGNG